MKRALLKLLQCAMVMGIAVGAVSVARSLTPAGVIINNQATATYTDSNAVLQSTSSNLVQTLVQEVVGVILQDDLTKAVVEDATFYFPHFLTNTGNGPESYTVCLDQNFFEGTDDFSFDSIQLFEDTDLDGLPDSGTTYPLVSTPTGVTLPAGPNASPCYQIPPLNGGDSIQIVVAAVINDRTPDLTPGEQAQYTIQAYADSDTSVVSSDTDTGFYTNEPIIEVLKSMSANQGVSPSGPYTITLTYRNIGATDGQNLHISEVLPTATTVNGSTPSRPGGMTYVTGSAEWTHNGGTTVSLTDTSLVAQTSSTANGTFCAYDTDCIAGGFPYGDDRASIVIDSVASGQTGTITFEVDIDAGLIDGDVLENVVQYKYENITGDDIPGPSNTDTLNSNTITFVIINAVTAPGVVANDTDTLATLGADDADDTNNVVPVASVEQGEEAFFDNYIWNTGDGVDSFDITLDEVLDREGNVMATPFPSGTVFELLRPDGISPLLDSNGNGTPDTGPIPAGSSFKVVLRILPPASLSGDNSGNGWDVTKIATSYADSNIRNAVTDRLLLITESVVDLTNDNTYDTDCVDVMTGIASPAAAGCDFQGEGYPNGEVDPVNTFNLVPGSVVSIPLWINNVGAARDAFDLSYSSTNFAANTLPASWTVKFYESTNGTDCSAVGDLVSSTSQLNGGESELVCAEVGASDTLLADGSSQSLFFRVLSPTSGKFDIKHEAVILTSQPLLDIIPDHFRQGRPGTFINYPHQITNYGNTNLECINITLADSLAADGWASLTFLDVDQDGQMSAADIPLEDQTLAPDASFNIIVRVFVPASAPLSTSNSTTVTVNGHVDDNDADPATCTGTVLTDAVTDTTSVSLNDMVITKSQAPDADCDGVPDSAYVFTRFQVAPGECIAYLLTSTNTGVQTMVNLQVNDDTPPFTTYISATESCTVTAGTPTNCSPPLIAPTDGDPGPIRWSITDLEPGGVIDATFGVQVE